MKTNTIYRYNYIIVANRPEGLQWKYADGLSNWDQDGTPPLGGRFIEQDKRSYDGKYPYYTFRVGRRDITFDKFVFPLIRAIYPKLDLSDF